MPPFTLQMTFIAFTLGGVIIGYVACKIERTLTKEE